MFTETSLDSSFPVDDQNLVIQGYNLLRYDHLTNTKRGDYILFTVSNN